MDEIDQLRQRVEHLERELARRVADDEVREMEFRSLQREVEIKAEYIARLERIEEEVIVPKDVHIRNLEAIIANLEAERSEGQDRSANDPSRSPWRRRRGR